MAIFFRRVFQFRIFYWVTDMLSVWRVQLPFRWGCSFSFDVTINYLSIFNARNYYYVLEICLRTDETFFFF